MVFMPYYVIPLTIPPKTPENNPVILREEIEGEMITKVEVHFPPGCRGFVMTNAFYGIEQIFPHKKGTYFKTDGETIKFKEMWKLPESPCVITLKGWSPRATYPHTLVWRLEVAPKGIVAPMLALARIYLLFKRMADFLVGLVPKIIRKRRRE